MPRAAALTVLVFILIVTALMAGVVLYRLTRPVPALALQLGTPASIPLAAGSPPPIPLPATGELALESDRDGRVATAAADQVHAIGSVAKTMTALEVLTDRPLTAGQDGPAYTITAADVALLRATIAADGSFVPVAVGEVYTERQLLLGLMLPSANNLAETLAVWVAGSREAFIASLNQRAVALGMRNTHFADPSGYSPSTVSSAADLVLLGRAALANPVLAEVVATQQAALPDGTIVRNLDAPLATTSGWLGIKTGETPAAGACLLFAARRDFPTAHASVTVVGAVLGQPSLDAAFAEAVPAAEASLDAYTPVDPTASVPSTSGRVSSPWGAQSALVTNLQPGGGGPIVARRGAVLALRATVATLPPAPLPSGSRVATVEGLLDGRVVAQWSITTTEVIPGPSTDWRLRHG